MPESESRLGLRLLSIKAEVESDQLLIDEQLHEIVRGFEEGNYKEARLAADILSSARITDLVWEATEDHLFDILDEVVRVEEIDVELAKAACEAARVIAQQARDTPSNVFVDAALGETLIEASNGEDSADWLVAAGTLLLSTAMDQDNYAAPARITKLIAENLLSLSREADSVREANLAAPGYAILGSSDGGGHARELVAESLDFHAYLLRPEPNLREGFLRFTARIAEECPDLLETHLTELAIHLRDDSPPVRRYAATALLELHEAIGWSSVRASVSTLDGPFRSEGTAPPLHALTLLREAAAHDASMIPEHVVSAFTTAVTSQSRFTEMYGQPDATDRERAFRRELFFVFGELAPRFPSVAEGVGPQMFDELDECERSEIEQFVPACGGTLAAANTNLLGKRFLEFVESGLTIEESSGSPETEESAVRADDPAAIAMSRFVTTVAQADTDLAVSAAEELCQLTQDSDQLSRLLLASLLLVRAHQQREDEALGDAVEESLGILEASGHSEPYHLVNTGSEDCPGFVEGSRDG